MSNNTDSEGLVIVWAFIIFFYVVSGSITTRMDMVTFMILSVSILFLVMLAVFVVIGFISLIVYTFKRDAADKRSLWEVIIKEYNSNYFVQVYRLLFRLTGEYLNELQWYLKFREYCGIIEMKIKSLNPWYKGKQP